MRVLHKAVGAGRRSKRPLTGGTQPFLSFFLQHLLRRCSHGEGNTLPRGVITEYSPFLTTFFLDYPAHPSLRGNVRIKQIPDLNINTYT